MIDDGKHDPPEVKIENHPWSIMQFELWERELQPPKPTTKRRKGRLWAILEAIGRATIYATDPTLYGGFYE